MDLKWFDKTKFPGLVPLPGSNNESWCQGLDGLSSRTAAYYQQGARFTKCGLVSIVEPEILLDGEHDIDRTFEVAQKVWAEVIFYLPRTM
ncbi:hypothetical protein V6N12_056674 [Hibiscus sabdariffa]|uniref:fructose-bisphosphate aldolase n=1 Tax=Hibiscus sabdariffa TaxID=183260 RepID=A0ABR1Z694_9ROSI